MSVTLLTASIAAASLFLFGTVIYSVSRNRLLLKYSLLWIALALTMLVCSFSPNPIFTISSYIGFENPSNFIFVVALFFLLSICLSLSIIVSKQEMKIKDLIQEQALLETKTQVDVTSENNPRMIADD